MHAINPDGTKKWAVKLDGAIGAFPALSTDGAVLYCITNAPTLYALNIVDGSVKWKSKILDSSGKGCAVAVDKMEMSMLGLMQPFILSLHLEMIVGTEKGGF